MKTVKVYIETTVTGPFVRDGKYGAALVFTKQNGEVKDLFVQGEETETTHNRSVLLAMIRAFQRFTEPCHIISYSTQGIHLSVTWFRQTIRKSGDGQSGESRMEKTYRTRNYGSCSWKRAKNTR